MHAFKTDRVHLYEALRDPLPLRTARSYHRLLDRRLAHEPTPYIIGRKEFFGLEFEVTRAAIIPRPETETLVELAVGFSRERYATTNPKIVDVGTGSGAIAVSLAHRLIYARVIAVDVSKRALSLARRNAARHAVVANIDFIHGDTLAPLTTPVDIIVANLPYVTTEQWEATPLEIREHEPRSGLDGGPDGLRYIRKLLRQAPAKLVRDGALFAEIGDWQGPEASFLARRAFPTADVDVRPDLAGRDRVLCVLT